MGTPVDEAARWRELGSRMGELHDLDQVIDFLGWDEETGLPERGRPGRGRQAATLEGLRHQRLVDPSLGELIDDLSARAAAGSDEAATLALVRRRRDRAMRVPERLVRALAECRSASLAAWEEARAERRFAVWAPRLAELLALVREWAAAVGGGAGVRRYDVLLDEHEPGMTAAAVGPVLDELRRELAPLAAAIAAAPLPDRSCLDGKRFPDALQVEFCRRLMRDLGFDFARGRQDRSTHPFTLACGDDDIRLTIRVREDNLPSAILTTAHEAGHALYYQGLPAAFHGTPLADAPSLGMHEAQARLWENHVGRHRGFWRHYLPALAALFPDALAGVTPEAMYRAVNAVAPGPIRVEADEVTYDLHILVRYRLELALVDGDLAVADLPAAWSDEMARDVGVRPADDRQGCLQDVHWALGTLGYFPTYTIGNLHAALLVEAFERERPDGMAAIERGEFGRLLSWLRERVHHQGHRFTAEETIRRATGSGLTVAPMLRHLRRKYGELLA